jgi:hypothetical protein
VNSTTRLYHLVHTFLYCVIELTELMTVASRPLSVREKSACRAISAGYVRRTSVTSRRLTSSTQTDTEDGQDVKDETSIRVWNSGIFELSLFESGMFLLCRHDAYRSAIDERRYIVVRDGRGPDLVIGKVFLVGVIDLLGIHVWVSRYCLVMQERLSASAQQP